MIKEAEKRQVRSVVLGELIVQIRRVSFRFAIENGRMSAEKIELYVHNKMILFIDLRINKTTLITTKNLSNEQAQIRC